MTGSLAMDHVLFYETNRSESARRQVRSAAAQHSHRIGPRKPKSSKKPKSHSEPSHQKRRSLKANNLTSPPTSSAPEPAYADTAAGHADKLSAHSPAYFPPQQASPTRPPLSAQSHHIHAPASNAPTANVAASPGTIDATAYRGLISAPDREKELKIQAAQAKLQEIHAFQRRHEAQTGRDTQQAPIHRHGEKLQAQNHQPAHVHAYSHPAPPNPSHPLQVPAPPPLTIERIEPRQQDSVPSTHSRNNSQATSSPLSPSTRLPQYSWTEYPRYGLGFNHLGSSLQMLAQVAVAEREASEARYPPAPPAPSDVPGFRQFDGKAQEPQPPNLRRSPPQSSRLHELPLPAHRPPATISHESGPQLAPMAVQSLTDQPPLPTGSTFGQFLQSAVNGQERVDEVHHEPLSASSNDHERRPHYSSG